MGALLWTVKSNSSRYKVRCFDNGRGVLALLTCSTLIISFGADQYGFELMAISFLLGYLSIFMILRKFNLQQPSGLMLLAILITFTHGCILYFSFLGQIFANFFLPVGLTFVQSFYESNRNFRYALATFCVVASNFGPGLDNAEHFFWEWGHHYYTRGLNGLQHNPLGWQSSTVLKLRNKLTKALLKLNFSETDERIPILFSGLHFHTRLQFLYPKNVWQPLPEFHLPQFVRDDRLDVLAENLKSESDLRNFITEGGYPIIIHGRRPWTNYPVFRFNCDSFYDDVENRKSNWEEAIADCTIQNIFNDPDLLSQYHLIVLKESPQLLKVYIHNNLLGNQTSLNFFGLKEYEEQWKWYQNLNWWQRILFQKVNPSERVFHLFRQANDHMDEENWLEAWKLLKKGLEIESDHTEMLKDLKIVEEELGVRKRELQ